MRKKPYSVISIIIIFLCGFLNNSEVKSAETIQRVDIPGLSNNAVLYMHQDQMGNMWFGTYDGLNLYNGRNTVTYRYEPDNQNSINGNIIRKIFDAGPNHIWVTTFMGVNLISVKEKKVIASYTQYPETYHLAADKTGNTLLLSLNDFLSYSNLQMNSFIDIHAPGIRPGDIKDLFTDNKDRFYLFSSKGVLMEVKTNLQTTPISCTIEETPIHDQKIEIAFSDNGVLYFIDANNILYKYDCDQETKTRIYDLTGILKKYNGLSKIIGWGTDVYLSFMDSGLIKLSTINDTEYTEIPVGAGIFSLCKDEKQDILWMGTDGQGVQMYYRQQSIFANLLPSFTQKPIRSIYTDEDNTLWIGTKGDGVFRIKEYNHLENGQSNITQYTTEEGLSHNFAFCFSKSKFRDVLWIGTEGPGLSYYSYSDEKMYKLRDPLFDGVMYVHSIQEVNDTTLWVATVGKGLIRITLAQNSVTPEIIKTDFFSFERNGRICNDFHSMTLLDDVTLILGSRGGHGVLRFNTLTNRYDFLPSSQTEISAIGDILCVHNSSSTFMYVGASSGMTKFTFMKDGKVSARQFDRRDGMMNDMIHGILEDDRGCLWLSSNKGLIKYNPWNDTFHNQSLIDIHVKEFSDDAYWKCPYTGRLFFGGINGIVWVDPELEPQEQYDPELRFWDLTMLGETHYLTEQPAPFVIPPKATVFTVSFVATDYIHGENYEYGYLLNGFNDSWIELQKDNKVTFANLPYGKYDLKVRYKNDVYSSKVIEYALPLVISPPWYLSYMAKWIYLFAVAFILVLVTWQIRHNWHNKQLLLTQRIKEEQKEKLYNAKLNFFTNITHELCTPLTLINGATEYLQQQDGKDKNQDKYVVLLQENVKGLNELIQEILDFRKIEESGLREPKAEWHNLSEFLYSQLGMFTATAEKDNLDFQMSVTEKLLWYTDLSFFKKILINLVSNAFKYTTEGGTVRVSLEIVNNVLELRVYNSGGGIDPDMIPRLFDRYQILEHMDENKYMQMTARHGLGLSICQSLVHALQGEIDIKSQPDEYVDIIVRLPGLNKEQSPATESKQDLKLDEEIKKTTILDSGKPVILVVDDNKDIVWFVADSLSAEYDVRKAYNATDALQMIQEYTPALIITDIIMPDVDGLEFIRKIKADKFSKHIPVIIISAKITDEEQAEGLNRGADAYLKKPFSALVLQSTVNRLISNKKEMKEYYYSPESAYTYKEGQLLHQEDQEFMDEVIRIISENLDKETLRPELIAEKMGLNSRNLYRRFKKISSLSPSDFIKDYRLTYAAQLLVTTNLSIQEIIYKVGLTNKSYFYREFFKKYQLTPKEYRSHS